MIKWEEKSFIDFVTFQRGFDLPQSKFVFGEVPVFGSTSILGYHNKSKVKAPGIITGRSGTLGEFQYTTQDFWPHNTSLWVKDFKGNDPKFSYYLMQCYDFKELNSGGAVPTLNRNLLKSLKVKIPPLPIQQKIAKILSNYDDLIENNLKRIKLLEESARLTYEEWFLRFRIDGKKLDIDPKSGLPFGWGKNNLGFLVNLHGGYPFKSADYGENEKYKIVTIKNVQNGYFDPKTNDSISFLPDNLKQNQKLENGDYIMSLTGNVGRVCLVYGKNYLLNQRVVKLQPKKLFDYSYIYLLFRNKYMTIQLENISNGAAQQNLSPVNVAKIKVPIPSEEQRENFNFKIKPCIDLIIQLNLKNQLLKEARDILLPRLMTGMIDTDDMDITV